VLYVYDDDDETNDELGWTDNKIVMSRIISKYDDELYLLKKNNKGEIIKLKKGYGNMTSLKTRLLKEIKTLCWSDDPTDVPFGRINFLIKFNL